MEPRLPRADLEALEEMCRLVRGDIIRMTTLAGSGHPGGSMSSTEILALLWTQADVDPADPWRPGRDRIVVSHGHVSPGVYSVLGRAGFFDPADAVRSFRQAGSPFEGHVERMVPGVELTTGNLGQGLSAACGFAVADRLSGHGSRTWVVMGDGEQQKGQISEARRFAAARDLGGLTAVIDCNGLQISGRCSDVMPFDLAAEYRADGWDVAEVDGHDLEALYQALRPSGRGPRAVLARTVMGRGVSFMENDEQYHGRAPTREEAGRALAELGLPDDIDELAAARAAAPPPPHFPPPGRTGAALSPGSPRTYPAGHVTDNRSAFGAALADLADSNPDAVPLVLDCDLSGSVKTQSFARAHPDNFIQAGIMEHHTASMGGAASLCDRVVFWADFGVFAADETFNQHRLNDINLANLKTVATHCGLDVGPDGKTHHCIKYITLLGCLKNCRVIVPADPNQTDRAVRFAASTPGAFFIAMGRSRAPVVDSGGAPRFGGDYVFEYGRHDVLRPGDGRTAILALGTMCGTALSAAVELEADGVDATVVSVSCPFSLAPDLLDLVRSADLAVTLEDHDSETGLGARLAVGLSSRGGAPPLLRLGVEGYGQSGEPADLYRLQGLTPVLVAERIRRRLRGGS
jgi:transketolase